MANNENDSVEDLLSSLVPARPSAELRERLGLDLERLARHSWLRRVSLVSSAAAAVLVVLAGTWWQLSASSHTDPRSRNARTVLNGAEETLVRLTNEARAQQGLPGLKLDKDLVAVARAHSHYMKLQRKLCFPIGGLHRFLMAVGYNYDVWGIAIHLVNDLTMEDAFASVMATQQTRKEILGDRYDDLGVGVVEVEEVPGIHFMTLVFGKKRT